MAVRRRLVDEVKPDPALEKNFVFSRKPQPPEAAPQSMEPAAAPVDKETSSSEAKETAPPQAKAQTSAAIARTPLTTRVRADFGAALKRASLERQLNGVFPQTVQDILEAALEPWLRGNGYLN
jgi:hypothetical protein